MGILFYKVILFILPAAMLCPTLARAADSSHVERIEIKSTYEGWDSKDESLEIKWNGSRYMTSRGEVTSEDKINALLNSLSAPAIQSVSVHSIGIDHAWIEQHQRALFNKFSSAQSKLISKQLADATKLNSIVQGIYNSSWTDDDTSLQVVIHLSNGQISSVHSKSQHPFMVPWTITGSLSTKTTFDTTLSRAIAALLPSSFLNRHRIQGDDLLGALREQLEDANRTQLDELEADDEVGDQISPIKEKYNIKQSSVSGMSGAGFDVSWGWHSLLTRKQTPNEQIGLDAHLNLKDKKLTFVSAFLKVAPTLIKTVENVSWLMRWLKDHPQSTIEINVVDDKSITQKAMDDFRKDFQFHNKAALVSKLQAAKDRSVFLTLFEDNRTSYSRWIVLPDGQMILWHETGKLVAKWSQSELGESWTDYGQTIFGKLVMPDGTLVSQ